MANNNRTEVAAFIEALAAIVDLEELKEVLNDQFAQSLTFRKDVTAVDTASGTKTLDFEDVDYITVTQSANSDYTLSNVLQGEIKYLKLTKSVGHTVDFTGATDVSQRKDYINTSVTSVIYRITNKDANLFVESINIDNDVVETKILEIGDWDMDADVFVNVAHGLDFSKITNVSVTLRNDDNDEKYSLPYYEDGFGVAAWVSVTNTTNVVLFRAGSSLFDSVDFDSTSFNRGWVTIEYLLT